MLRMLNLKSERHKPPLHLPRLIMVARMKSPKRHDLLLEALAQVRTTLGVELPVTLAGDGPLTAKLQAQAKALNLHQHHLGGRRAARQRVAGAARCVCAAV